MFTIATSQEWMSMCLWFLLWKNNTVVNILLWISIHEYSWRKIPRKWIAANAFIILMLSNWPLEVLPLMYPPTGWCTHPMMPKEASFWRWNNGHEGERTNNALYYLWLSNKASLVLCLGSLGADSTEDESPVVLFHLSESRLIFGNLVTRSLHVQGILSFPPQWPICGWIFSCSFSSDVWSTTYFEIW